MSSDGDHGRAPERNGTRDTGEVASSGRQPLSPRVAAEADSLEDLRQEVAGGLLYTHHRANANTSRILEVAAFSYAAIEILKEKGLVAEEELNERKNAIGKRLVEKYLTKNMGVMLQDGDQDKYAFRSAVQIDCENRIHLCRAACCKLQFALSRQDVQEGVVKWDLEHPYMNARGKDGYCVHLKRGTCHCSIYANRPIPCRGYDCRQDKRIWQDFEKRIPSPDLDKLLSQSQPNPPGKMEAGRSADGIGGNKSAVEGRSASPSSTARSAG
jgi:putative zinc- or iron-chelating protein